MESEYAEYARKTLLDAVRDSPDQVHIKALAPEKDPTTWVTLPREIVRHMISAIRGEGEDKPFPANFLGGRVVVAARFKGSKGTAPHQGAIIREYEDDGEIRWSVHYLVAHRITDPWDGDTGTYDLPSLEDAFDEFTERMHRRGRLSRNR